MDQYIYRAGEAWTRLQDGTWAKWNPRSSQWEAQLSAPPPPPPPPPLTPPQTGFGVAPSRPATATTQTRSFLGALRGNRVALLGTSFFLALMLGFVGFSRLGGATSGSKPAGRSGAEANASKLDGKIALAGARLQKQDSFRMSMSMSMATPQGNLSMRGRGIFDNRAGFGRLNFSMPSMGQIPGVEGPLRFDAIYDFRDGLVMYMRMPQLSEMTGSASTWFKMDVSKLSEQAGIDLDALMQVDQSNPMQNVDYLQGIENVELVGREKVRGTPTQHYVGVVDFADAMKDMSGEAAKAVHNAMKLSGLSEIPVEVWLDKKGLLRRMTFDFSASSGTAGMSMGRMTMEMYDYGTPVNVAVPDPSEVTDFMELMNQSG